MVKKDNVIGKGVADLNKWLNKCSREGGQLIVRTGAAGVKYTDRIIVSCRTAAGAVQGGTITGLDYSLVKAIRKAQEGKEKLDFKKLKSLTSSYKPRTAKRKKSKKKTAKRKTAKRKKAKSKRKRRR